MEDEIIKPVLVSIIGPTAVGKTSLSIELAEAFRAEIISADSRQFYRELEIGTAKPTDSELERTKHHFINSHSIEESYSAGAFGRDAAELLQKLFETKKAMIAVGGSSLYLKAIWEGFDDMPAIDPSIREQLNEEMENDGFDRLLVELKEADPAYYAEVDLQNRQRIVRALEVIRGTGKKFTSFRKAAVKEPFYRNLKIGLNMQREYLFDRINFRMDEMIEKGLFREVESLYAHREHNALKTVGYTEIFNYMDGKYDREEAIRLLKRNSRRYAKRQLTWFNRYHDIHWFEPSQTEEIKSLIAVELKGSNHE